MEKLFERLWDGLTGNTLSTVAALIIFLLALPLIRAGLSRPPAPSSPPPPPGADVDPRWLVPNLLQMQSDVAELRRQVAEISAQLEQLLTLRRPFWLLNTKIDAIAKLLRRRAARPPK